MTTRPPVIFVEAGRVLTPPSFSYTLLLDWGFAMSAGGGVPIASSREEQRKTERALLIIQVEFKAAGDYTLGHLQDISEGGLLVLTPETVASGSEVIVRLNLPPYTPGVFIESQGLVVRVQPARSMGIEFLQLNEQQQQAIARYVRQTIEGEGAPR